MTPFARGLVVSLLCVSSFGCRAESRINSEPESRVIPWVELNHWSVEAHRSAVINGLKHAAGVFEYVIVTTLPDENPEIYRLLQRAVPDVRIIPGTKVSAYTKAFGRFDSPRVWKRIADDVKAACRITGTSKFLLENESALTPLLEEKQQLRTDQFAEALRQLPREVEYLCWPGVMGSRWTPEKVDVTLSVSRVVAATLPNVVLIDAAYQTQRLTRHKETDEGRAAIQRRLKSLGRTTPILYFAGRESELNRDWDVSDLPMLVRGDVFPDKQFIMYSGIRRFEQAMGRAAHLLREDTAGDAPTAPRSPSSSPGDASLN